MTETIRCSLPARLSRLIRQRCRPKQPLHDANGTDGPPPQLSGGHDTWRPELHQEPAPPPSERACDAGEGISVRVERRPGPWPCGARTPRLAGYGRDSRCLVRPTRLTERQTRQICASDAAPAATTTSPPSDDVTRERRPTRPPVRIGHLNARSLLPSIDDVNVALGTLNLDILCVSETWLSPAVADSFLVFPGYKVTRSDRWREPERWRRVRDSSGHIPGGKAIGTE